MLAIAEAFEIKTSAKITDENLNGHIVKLKTNSFLAIADSGSPLSFPSEATHAVYNKRRLNSVQKHPHGGHCTKSSLLHWENYFYQKDD